MKNPDKRLGFNGLDEIKKHKFFEGFDWNKLEKRNVNPILIK